MKGSRKTWKRVVGEAGEALDDWLDVIELMVEEEAEGTTEDAVLAHDAVEDATAYLFDEVSAVALLVTMERPEWGRE